ncbi:MAG: ATP phosphoribosyltransferase regulatory subunit [Clostridia bacterium]|nr:ATP phosphoribosyltransferase regulatory subunit [Clostridia bacterium]
MKPETLRMDERASIALRTLYRQYGYLPYQVNTFEEYDLYMRSRSMLSSEQILTFPGVNGALMALKPDITLSIVKNTKDEDVPVKVCYAERIYRVPKGADGFKEIMQTGVECIGCADDYAMGEVLLLAAKSLETISPAYILDVSDMSIVSSIVCAASSDSAVQSQLLTLIGEKNEHGLCALCKSAGVSDENTALLRSLISVYGPLEETLPAFEALALPAACLPGIKSLRVLSAMLHAQGIRSVNLDFSVINDMNYYNGLIFSGFIAGLPSSVLSGGRYDLLMRRMGRMGSAVGFAVYLDQLERLSQEKTAFDVDVLIELNGTADPVAAANAAKAYIDQGLSVRVQRAGGAKVRAAKTVCLTGEEAQG